MRPLLKWAGGKRQLLPVLRDFYPARFNRYIEPFVGSGAVFFDLLHRRRLENHSVTLADMNPDLVGCYRALRDDPAAVIAELQALADEHRQNAVRCYYDVRDRRFNPLRADLLDGAYTPELAAMLIYLNRTCFNGLFRLNRSGAFNVPAGRYVDPRICDPEHLRAVAAALRAPGVTVECAPFEATLGKAGLGDLVYCDPPYAPLSRTASFARYTAGGFTPFDHRRLHQAVVEACQRGALVLLSNSSAPEVVSAYGNAEARKAGLVVRRVPARRAINSRASARGPVDELIITNIETAGLKTNAEKPQKLRMAKVMGPRGRTRTA